jgi:hypothetical protein
MTSVRFKDETKSKLEQDKIIAANYLFHEEGVDEDRIRKQLKIESKLIGTVIFSTFEEWRQYRDGLGK